MSPSMQLIEATNEALREALARRDWTVIAELDQRCRLAVEEAMVEPRQDEAMLRERMESLLALYRELVAVCQSEQQRLANELRQLNQSQQGAKVYQLFG